MSFVPICSIKTGSLTRCLVSLVLKNVIKSTMELEPNSELSILFSSIFIASSCGLLSVRHLGKVKKHKE